MVQCSSQLMFFSLGWNHYDTSPLPHKIFKRNDETMERFLNTLNSNNAIDSEKNGQMIATGRIDLLENKKCAFN